MKPFDLEAAKRGEPIQTREGTPVKFIAHVPEADQSRRVVVLIGGEIVCFDGNGSHAGVFETELDLFMAPRKRTVWINLYRNSEGRYASHTYSKKEFADENGGLARIGGRAWPFEIEE